MDCLSLFGTGALKGFKRNAWVDSVGFLLLGGKNGAAGRLVFASGHCALWEFLPQYECYQYFVVACAVLKGALLVESLPSLNSLSRIQLLSIILFQC